MVSVCLQMASSSICNFNTPFSWLVYYTPKQKHTTVLEAQTQSWLGFHWLPLASSVCTGNQGVSSGHLLGVVGQGRSTENFFPCYSRHNLILMQITEVSSTYSSHEMQQFQKQLEWSQQLLSQQLSRPGKSGMRTALPP